MHMDEYKAENLNPHSRTAADRSNPTCASASARSASPIADAALRRASAMIPPRSSSSAALARRVSAYAGEFQPAQTSEFLSIEP